MKKGHTWGAFVPLASAAVVLLLMTAALPLFVSLSGNGTPSPEFPVSRRIVDGHYVSRAQEPARTERRCAKECVDASVPAGWTFRFQEGSGTGTDPADWSLEIFLPDDDERTAQALALAPGAPVRLAEVVHPFGTNRPPLLEDFTFSGLPGRGEGRGQ